MYTPHDKYTVQQYAISSAETAGYDVTIENVIGKTCSKGVSISGSGAWVGNSTFSNNDIHGIEIWIGSSSTTAVKTPKLSLR